MKRVIAKKFTLLVLSIILASNLFCACENKDGNNIMLTDTKFSQDIFAMDTYMTVTAYGKQGEKAVKKAIKRIEELDAMFNVVDENGEIAQINANGEGTLSKDGINLMSKALEISKMTDGAFTPAIFPMMKAWGFTNKQFRIPEKEELKQLLSLTDASLIELKGNKIKFKKKGVEIDFGGIAKGYTSKEIIDIFKEDGVTSGLVSLGGNVSACGNKPNGEKWRVAIQNPNKKSEYLGILAIKDLAVVTSGGYERYFQQDGIIYHHIIDPYTGYPSDSGLLSVTVVCDDDTLADGLSTALFVKGTEKALEFWKKNADLFDLILYTKDKELYVTEGISDDFSSKFQWNTVHR